MGVGKRHVLDMRGNGRVRRAALCNHWKGDFEVTVAGWVALITGVLKFPETILKIVNELKKVPSEKHAELLDRMRKESDSLKNGGRPEWDK